MNVQTKSQVESMADILADYLSGAGYSASSSGFLSYSEPVWVTVKKGKTEVIVGVDSSGRGFTFDGVWKSGRKKGGFQYKGKGGPKSDAKAVVDLVKAIPSK